jgi:hypothetical protein
MMTELEGVLERIRERTFPDIPSDLVRDVLDAQRSSQDQSAVVRRIAELIALNSEKDS